MGAIIANDFIFEIDTTTEGTPDTEIGEVQDFEITGGEVSQVDQTVLKGKRKKSKPGQLSQATFTMNAFTDLTDAGQNAAREGQANRSTKTLKVTAPTGETWTFSGYFTNESGASGGIDSTVTTAFNFVIDGDVITDDGQAA